MASTTARSGERGAILLLALGLVATFGLLSLALLATADSRDRVMQAGAAMDLAEATALAGIEWAAAREIDRGRIAGTTTVPLAGGPVVRVTVANTSPHVVAVGEWNGVVVTHRADLRVTQGAPLPHAFASFDGTNRLDHDTSVTGRAYLADGTPLTGGGRLLMNGDLELVSSAAPPAGKVVHTSGATRRSVLAISPPTVDTAPFAALPAGPGVRHYTGNTHLKDVTFTGIVVVRLGAGQHLRIEDSNITGTVVVTAAAGLLGAGGLLGLGLGRPAVELKGNVTLTGGTPTTGNLALLAAFCTLKAETSSAVVSGVTLAWEGDRLKATTFRGQLVLMTRIVDTAGAWAVDRSVGFEVDTPIGISWPGASSVRVTWLGRQ